MPAGGDARPPYGRFQTFGDEHRSRIRFHDPHPQWVGDQPLWRPDTVSLLAHRIGPPKWTARCYAGVCNVSWGPWDDDEPLQGDKAKQDQDRFGLLLMSHDFRNRTLLASDRVSDLTEEELTEFEKSIAWRGAALDRCPEWPSQLAQLVLWWQPMMLRPCTGNLNEKNHWLYGRKAKMNQNIGSIVEVTYLRRRAYCHMGHNRHSGNTSQITHLIVTLLSPFDTFDYVDQCLGLPSTRFNHRVYLWVLAGKSLTPESHTPLPGSVSHKWSRLVCYLSRCLPKRYGLKSQYRPKLYVEYKIYLILALQMCCLYVIQVQCKSFLGEERLEQGRHQVLLVNERYTLLYGSSYQQSISAKFWLVIYLTRASETWYLFQPKKSPRPLSLYMGISHNLFRLCHPICARTVQRRTLWNDEVQRREKLRYNTSNTRPRDEV